MRIQTSVRFLAAILLILTLNPAISNAQRAGFVTGLAQPPAVGAQNPHGTFSANPLAFSGVQTGPGSPVIIVNPSQVFITNQTTNQTIVPSRGFGTNQGFVTNPVFIPNQVFVPNQVFIPNQVFVPNPISVGNPFSNQVVVPTQMLIPGQTTIQTGTSPFPAQVVVPSNAHFGPQAPSQPVHPSAGTARADVIRQFGQPVMTVVSSQGETLYFSGGITVIMQNGQVISPK